MSVAAVQKLLCLAEKWSQVCHPQNFHDFFEQFSSLCAKKYQNCCMIIFRQNVMFQKLSSIQGNFLLNRYTIFFDMKWSVVFEKCTTLKQFNVRNYSEIFASGFEKIK